MKLGTIGINIQPLVRLEISRQKKLNEIKYYWH